MRIPEVRTTEAIPEVRPSANQSATPSQSELVPAAPVDHSEVSPAASVASQAVDTRDERVAELRQRYLSGSYQPDTTKVAAKIVEEHLG